jgi:hypothetical protein
MTNEIELTRTWVVAGSRQAALDKCDLMALDPTYVTTRLVFPKGVHNLRGERARLGDTIAYGYLGDADNEGLRFMFEWLREAGFDFDETDLR